MIKLNIPPKTSFLVVDDMYSIQDALFSTLRNFGIEGNILVAKNIDTAKEKLLCQKEIDQPIEFIFCDWKMPGECGIDLLKYVRSQPDFKNLPFVFVTYLEEKSNIIQAICAGASNYIKKPWKPEELVRIINEAYHKHYP